MKKIITGGLLFLLLFVSSAHAVPSNFFRHPTCHDDVTTLPIFELSTRYNDEHLKQGTIFLIDDDMWVTAWHAIYHDGKTLTHHIILPDGSEIEAGVLQIDETADIAILYAPSENMKPMNLSSDLLEQFEPVWNVGMASISNKIMVSFEGIIMRVVDDIFYLSTAVAFPGMSGGPQVRCNGDNLEVVAVVIKTTMDIFKQTEEVLDNGTIIKTDYYVIEGSKSSPHIVKNVVEVIFGVVDDE